MVDASFPSREELEKVLKLVFEEAVRYLETIDSRPVRSTPDLPILERFDGSLPDQGVGASRALLELIERGIPAALHSSGPRNYHFVMGGHTPAALGADLLAVVLDQAAYAWVSSPLAVKLELVSLDWLKSLFGLPTDWTGVMTTGATMANFVGLSAARQWWGERIGHDPAAYGLSGLPSPAVFSGGYVHASAVKVLGMLGIGRDTIQILSRDAEGRLDLASLEKELAALAGAPAIIIGNAGEVNAGDFDPISKLADLAERYDCWLHVDGAFGLFASVSPQTSHLVSGVERAHSVTVDGHKWLNVPYDCRFSFVCDKSLMVRAFTYSGDYLPKPDDPEPNLGTIAPESSRRARSLAVWATLRAYGRRGYQRLFERHLELAQYLAALIDKAPDLERLAPVHLNIVCFRHNPGGRSEEALNLLNTKLGQAILEDGRVFAGTTLFGSKVALRPAITNWRIRRQDLDLFVQVVRELASG